MRALLLALLLTGCGATPLGSSFGQATVLPPLPDWPRVAFPRQDDRPLVRVVGGRLADFHHAVADLPAGAHHLMVHNDVPGASVEEHGLDLTQEAASLWVHGRGPARDWLPQFAMGPINGGINDDWPVELPPGDYEIEQTLGGGSVGIWRVR